MRTVRPQEGLFKVAVPPTHKERCFILWGPWGHRKASSRWPCLLRTRRGVLFYKDRGATGRPLQGGRASSAQGKVFYSIRTVRPQEGLFKVAVPPPHKERCFILWGPWGHRKASSRWPCLLRTRRGVLFYKDRGATGRPLQGGRASSAQGEVFYSMRTVRPQEGLSKVAVPPPHKERCFIL